VRRGILLPIVLYALQPEDEKIADQFMADPRVQQEWEGQTLDYREIITHVAIWRARTDGLPDQDHPGERYRPRRILVSFHRVAEVKGFVARHERIMRFLAERHPELAPVDDGMAFGFVGSTPAGQREEIHEAVSTLRWADDKPLGYAVIAQCGALTESYDMPDLDMAILVTPKNSTVAIQQLIGRITRKPNGWAYKPRGSAAVTVAWNQQTYDVTWARRRLNPDYCDTCGEAWRCHVPELITAADARKGRPAPPPTERQLAARAAFADRKHREAAERADKLSQELVST
jgi:superfamily II DNA or RNA helicase